MSKVKVALGAFVLALALAGCDVSNGQRCEREGDRHINKDDRVYYCQKVINVDGSRPLVWVQQAPLTPDRP